MPKQKENHCTWFVDVATARFLCQYPKSWPELEKMAGLLWREGSGRYDEWAGTGEVSAN